MNEFEIRYDMETGGVKSLSNKNDSSKMNWVKGENVWGTVKDGTLISCVENDNGITSVYKTKNMQITVHRYITGNRYREKYILKNILDTDILTNRGAIGIYTTFNDNYETAETSMTSRCHTHIWCGRNTFYVNAVKMGMCDFGLGLVLINGSLDTYSIERNFEHGSEDRGDFILNPSIMHLLPSEETVLEWELFWYSNDNFFSELSKYDSVLLVDAENYTVFEGETISFSVNRENARIFLGDTEIKSHSKDGKTFIKYRPNRIGRHTFTIKYGNRETIAEFFVQIELKKLVKKRVDFIVGKQQFHRDNSALDGAYLIYDNQDKCMFFDDTHGDYNASRERLGMGILIAKYLQSEFDESIFESLMQYYDFVTREFFDRETGAVYNTIGKNPEFKRLYNAPWMALFMMELYKLTSDKQYLIYMYRALAAFYKNGGDTFYPNGLSIYETVRVLKDAEMSGLAQKLTDMYKKHVSNMIKNGLNYPSHEVRYEQTIVTPAVTFIAQLYKITGENYLINECKKHLEILQRFNGAQPSFFLNDIAIRHWDGFWFGKRRLYGDTFPHYWSILSSIAFLHYSEISDNEEYKKRAFVGARNNLCLFNANGSASCAHIYPLTVNGIRGEYFDEFANDQDFALYYFINFFEELKQEKE